MRGIFIAGPLHRVLGEPDPLRGHEIGELLVQIGSDAEAGFVWGDGGIVYFTVPDREALNEEVSAVEAHVESTSRSACLGCLECHGAQLGDARGPRGEPSSTDSLVIDLPTIVDEFAECLESIPVLFAERDD